MADFCGNALSSSSPTFSCCVIAVIAVWLPLLLTGIRYVTEHTQIALVKHGHYRWKQLEKYYTLQGGSEYQLHRSVLLEF